MIKYMVLVLKGIVYGVTNLVPAIGGGIILILLGIYEPFVDAVGNILNWRRWKQYLPFLFCIGLGAAIGMIGLAKIISGLLDTYPALTMFFFMGLLIGSIPSILRMHGDMRLTVGRAVAAVVGVLAVVGFKAIERQGTQLGFSTDLRSTPGMVYNALTAFAAGGASVTPGMDGSYIFLLAGTYKPITEALSALAVLAINWAIIIPTGIGSVVGIVLFSKLIDTAIKRAPSIVYYCVLGIIAGSLYGLWPGDVANTSIWGIGLVFVLGAGIGLYFGRPTGRDATPAAQPSSRS